MHSEDQLTVSQQSFKVRGKYASQSKNVTRIPMAEDDQKMWARVLDPAYAASFLEPAYMATLLEPVCTLVAPIVPAAAMLLTPSQIAAIAVSVLAVIAVVIYICCRR